MDAPAGGGRTAAMAAPDHGRAAGTFPARDDRGRPARASRTRCAPDGPLRGHLRAAAGGIGNASGSTRSAERGTDRPLIRLSRDAIGCKTSPIHCGRVAGSAAACAGTGGCSRGTQALVILGHMTHGAGDVPMPCRGARLRPAAGEADHSPTAAAALRSVAPLAPLGMPPRNDRAICLATSLRRRKRASSPASGHQRDPPSAGCDPDGRIQTWAKSA